MVEIHGAYLEINLSQTHVQRDTHVRVWKHPTRSLHFKRVTSQHQLRVASQSRISTSTKSRVSIPIENRISTATENHFLTSLKFASALDQRGDHVYEGRVLSHTRSMSLLLQSAQHYTNKSNRQLYQFNSTLTNKPKLIQVLDWVSKILVTVLSEGFKQFDSTLTKTRIQTGSSDCRN